MTSGYVLTQQRVSPCHKCRHTDESSLHLFAQRSHTKRLWAELGASVPASWDTYESVARWWKVVAALSGLLPKTM